MFASRSRLLVATLWVGSLWTVGYVVAPTLFNTLSDRVLAGTIAGSLFHVEAWLSIGCASILMLLIMFARSEETAQQKKFLLFVIFAMLGCTLISHFGLRPFMADLRAAMGAGGSVASDARMQFSILHGVSSVFYLMESLLGVALILKLR